MRRISDTAALTAVMVGLLLVVVTAMLVLSRQSPQQPAAREPGQLPTVTASLTTRSPSPHPTRKPSDRETCVAGEQKQTLTIVTFNIHSARAGDGSVHLAEIADELASWKADVILLQEVDRGRTWTGRVDMPVVLAGQLDMAWAFGDNVRRSVTNNYGTAILSRYPIVSYQNTLLPAPAGTQQRGLLRATIDLGGGIQVNVYGTHLENTSADARLQQMQAIAPILRADPLPKVLGGDFNSRPGSPVLTTATAVAKDTWSAVGAGAGLTHPAGIPRTRIDYLMYDGGSDADLVPLGADVLPSGVSDHRAVRAAYQLTTDQGDVCVPVVPEQDQG